MIIKTIQKTNIKVSSVGLGTWAIGGVFWGGTDEKEAERAINASIDEGVNFIDTAPAYGFGLAEELVGKIIKNKREKVVIATKCGLVWDKPSATFHYSFPLPGGNKHKDVFRNLSRKSIQQEIKQSLSRLKTDYIDIYITHWPDPNTPIQETAGALLDLKQKGYIRAVGLSNVNIDILKGFSDYIDIDVDQEHYNIIDRKIEFDIIPFCLQNNITIIAYGALAQGLLSGKINPERKFTPDDARLLFNFERFKPENIALINNLLKKYLGPIAEKHRCTISNIAVASIIQDNNVVALCGARNELQAKENANSGRIILDEEDKKMIDLFISSYKL